MNRPRKLLKAALPFVPESAKSTFRSQVITRSERLQKVFPHLAGRRRREVMAIARGDAGRRVADALVEDLKALGIGHFTGGATSEQILRLNFDAAHRQAVAGVLARLEGRLDTPMWFKPKGSPKMPVADLPGREVLAYDVYVTEEVVEVGPDDLISVQSRIEIDFWNRDLFDDRFVAKRYNQVVRRLEPDVFSELVDTVGGRSGVDLAALDPYPSMESIRFPIDVVYTWVDDKDPEWAARKAAHTPDDLGGTGIDSGGLDKERFNNRNELKFSMRSIQTFAPWVRHIFLVTDRQCPDWLDPDHPDVTLVDHSEIYRDPSVLPVFNSHSIETQLHHIPGLSEHFIYFNDDVFLGEAVSPSDFFEANGCTRFFPAAHTWSQFGLESEELESYQNAALNGMRLLGDKFGAIPHRAMRHVPHPANTRILAEMERLWQTEWDTCMANRFRSDSDLSPLSFLYHHYAYQQQAAVPGRISNRYLSLWKATIVTQLERQLRTGGHQTICINDVGLQPEREDEVNAAVAHFLEHYFPLPSRFER